MVSGINNTKATTAPFQFRCYDGMHFTTINTNSRINFIMISIFDLIISVPAFLLNATFLYVAFKHSKFRKSTSNLLLINLAFLDTLLAALVLPLHGVQMLMNAQSNSACWLNKLNDLTSVILSTPAFLNLVFITFDTYCGIVFPFFYTEHVTPTKLLTLMWLSWIVFIIAAATFNNIPSLWNVYTLGYAVIDSLAIAFFIVSYAHIYSTVSKIYRRVSCVNVAMRKVSTANGGGGSKEKTIIISFFIVLFFVLSFLPSAIYYALKITGNETSEIRTYLFPWTYSLRLSSALVNSLIYYWRLSNIRKATMELLPDCLKISKQIDSPEKMKLNKNSSSLPVRTENQIQHNRIAPTETSMAEGGRFCHDVMTSQKKADVEARSNAMEFGSNISSSSSSSSMWDKKDNNSDDRTISSFVSDSTTIRSVSR